MQKSRSANGTIIAGCGWSVAAIIGKKSAALDWWHYTEEIVFLQNLVVRGKFDADYQEEFPLPAGEGGKVEFQSIQRHADGSIFLQPQL
jgi:hypothetical protein